MLTSFEQNYGKGPNFDSFAHCPSSNVNIASGRTFHFALAPIRIHFYASPSFIFHFSESKSYCVSTVVDGVVSIYTVENFARIRQ